MALPATAVKPKKKRAPVVLGCDQCRRRKTKCDQARPTCGPCVYAGLMECTFLLGKTPVPKRKKAHTEVEILEARLETIESAYSERLSQMESLLNRVMPGVQIQDQLRNGKEIAGGQALDRPGPPPSNTQRQGTASTNESEWADIDSPLDGTQPLVPDWEQGAPGTSSGNMERSPVPLFTSEFRGASNLPTSSHTLKEEIHDGELPIPDGQLARTVGKSPASSLAQSFASTTDTVHGDSEGDDELGELAATMDKLRLFDASYYFGKGTILFTSTDKNKFWDEEISFDVHDAQDIDIPPEALIMPPVEVIDTLFDIYYSHFYVFLPMIQKTTLLQALEDRHEPQSIFLLNSVFMAAALTGGCTHTACYSDPLNPKTISTPFFERARLVLDYCIGIPRVSTVQGLMLLSRYPKIAGLGHHYIQQAALMAADLGLHRKCDRWISDKEAQETRKRVFWCVYVVDSATASITGRRPLIDDSEIDVPLLVPSTTDGEVEHSNTLYLVNICKLWRIFRNVKQYIFNAVEVKEMVPGSLPKSYEQQLIQWQLQLPAILRFSFDIKAGDPRAIYNARAGVAQQLYESTLILLHKPYLHSEENLKRAPYRSQDICIKAASKITDIAKVLVKTFDKTFEITGVAEYAIVNAIRIQVMYMMSKDPSIAEPNQANFEYLVRFFREFYSAPRCNIDEQNINCILTFFDEFVHSVKGLSESTVHICAGAIKNMAIAKRSRIALGRHASGTHGAQPAVVGGDDRKLSRLVKIGREERAKARVTSSSSPTSSSRDQAGTHRKRLSHVQQEGQHRYGEQHNTQHPQHHHYHHHHQQQQQSRHGSLSSSPSSLSGLQDNDGTYSYPGKFQKLSQFVGPFGGPLVMESLSQYQTSTAILSQPPLTSAIPLTTSAMSPMHDPFHTFGQQQAQNQHVEQQQQHGHSSRIPQRPISPPNQSQQPLGISTEQQQLFDQATQSMDSFDVLNPSFWGDFSGLGGGVNSFQQSEMQLQNQTIMTTGPGSSSVPGLSAATDVDGFASGFTRPSSMYGISTGDIFDPMDAQQPSRQQQEHPQSAQRELVSPPGGFISSKVDLTGNASEGVDDRLNADGIQTLLEQTMDDSRPTSSNAPLTDTSTSSSIPLTAQQQQQQHLLQNGHLQQSDVRTDFYSSSWQNRM
ncbi:hypothetical protein BGZ68_003767 [Mortierella alpina]|nr:hypothetical protein BGZ68_003767 [Mortierella alpina]